MNKYIFCAAFALASLALVAQKKTKVAPQRERVRVEWGGEFEGGKRETVSKVIGQDDKWVYVLKKEGSDKYTIDLVGKEMDAAENYVLEYKGDDLDLVLEDVVMFSGRLFVLGSYRNKREKTKHLVYAEIDKESFELGELKEISMIDYEEGSKKNAGDFSIRFSEDESKVLVLNLLPRVKKENEKYKISVFDSSFGLLWEREEELTYDQNLFDVKSISVSNDGGVFILGKLYKDKRREERKDEVNYSYQLMAYFNQDDKEQYEVAYQDLFIREVLLIPQRDAGVLTMLGFYGEEVGGLKGTFVMDIDVKSRDVKSFKTSELGLEFYTQNKTARQAKKIEKKAAKGKSIEAFAIELRKVFYGPEGELMVVAEEAFVQAVTTRVGNATHTNYYYNYLDIVVFSINKDREINWAQRIPKSQITVDDGGFFSSFFVTEANNKFYFMYNDNKENLKVVEPGKAKPFGGSMKNSMAVCAIMDVDGGVTKTSLFSTKTEEVFARPKVFYELEDGEIVIYAQRKKKHQYGRIDLRETASDE